MLLIAFIAQKMRRHGDCVALRCVALAKLKTNERLTLCLYCLCKVRKVRCRISYNATNESKAPTCLFFLPYVPFRRTTLSFLLSTSLVYTTLKFI